MRRRSVSAGSVRGSGNDGDHPFFVPKKRLGQNFLADPKVISRIADACDLKPEETILEIGPGAGALTRALAPHVAHIIAVEADGQLPERLRKEFDPSKLTVHHADFLKFDLSQLPRPIKVIGNLPYYISTPIMTRVIENRAQFSSLFMTVQLEFGERLVARPGTKEYGSLSVFVQTYARPKVLFNIGNRSFRPVPKVNSCFMRIDLGENSAVDVADEKLFDQVVRLAFQQRRKSLLNSLASLRTKEILSRAFERAQIAPQSRAEQLTPTDFARLTKAFLTGD